MSGFLVKICRNMYLKQVVFINPISGPILGALAGPRLTEMGLSLHSGLSWERENHDSN
jgi:hypothetical protein